MGPLSLFRYSLSFSCNHLIPGMKSFQAGVDGAKMDLLILEKAYDDNGFKNPVVYFTCHEGKETESERSLIPNTHILGFLTRRLRSSASH